MGLQKRNRRLVKYLIEEVLSAKYHDRNQSASAIQEFGYDDLSVELQNEYSKEVRFIACYNSDVARKNKITRERNIKKFEKLFEEKKKKGTLSEVKEVYHKLKSFLSKYHMTKLYNIKLSKIEMDDAVKEDNEENYQILIYRNADAIEFEEQIDGRYFLQTEVGKSKLSKELVERYYKSLQKVERSFRILKNEFDIRPVNVRKETRIQGYIMICYLALLIETLIERKINEMYPNDTDRKKQKAMLIGEENGLLNMRILKEELETVILVPLYFGKGKKPKYISTSIPNNIRKLLSSLGIKNALDPEKLYYSKKGMRDYNG